MYRLWYYVHVRKTTAERRREAHEHASERPTIAEKATAAFPHPRTGHPGRITGNPADVRHRAKAATEGRTRSMSIDIYGIYARARGIEETARLEIEWADVEYFRDMSLDFFMPGKEWEGALLSGSRDFPPIARLTGTLILARAMDKQGADFWAECDAESAELGAFATEVEIEDEGLLKSFNGKRQDMLYIHELELSPEVLEAKNLWALFYLIPQAVFSLYNVYPDLMGYLIAENNGFYSAAASRTRFDPRSVDGYSPLVFSENGFRLSGSGRALFYTVD